jgi:hypothetical protein
MDIHRSSYSFLVIKQMERKRGGTAVMHFSGLMKAIHTLSAQRRGRLNLSSRRRRPACLVELRLHIKTRRSLHGRFEHNDHDLTG